MSSYNASHAYTRIARSPGRSAVNIVPAPVQIRASPIGMRYIYTNNTRRWPTLFVALFSSSSQAVLWETLPPPLFDATRTGPFTLLVQYVTVVPSIPHPSHLH